jgi:hypothetical protein
MAFSDQNADLGTLIRLYNARRLAGTAQPNELESLYKANLGASAERQRAGRSLALQAERDAETRRMNLVNEAQAAENTKAGKLAAIGQLGTTGLGYYMMSNKDKPGTGLGIVDSMTGGLKDMGNRAIGGVNWLRGKPTVSAADQVGQVMSVPTTTLSPADIDSSTFGTMPPATGAQDSFTGALPAAAVGGLAGNLLGKKASDISPAGGTAEWESAISGLTTYGLSGNPYAAGVTAAIPLLKRLFS